MTRNRDIHIKEQNMPEKTDKFIENIMKGKNLKAKENLKDIIEDKITVKIKNILTKEEKAKSKNV